MKDKKDPFAPILLDDKQSKWFVDYLEGKVESKKIEENRRNTLQNAEKIKDEDVVCLS